MTQNERAAANREFVRGKIAERGLTRQVESMAALAVIAGFQSWFACQQHMDMTDLGLAGKTGADLTKALLRTSGEWTR